MTGSGRSTDGLGRQLLAATFMALVGAMLTLLLTSSGKDVRLTRVEQDVRDIKTDLAAGGPAPLAGRVTNIEATLQEVKSQVRDVYTVVVLKQSPK